MIAPIVIDIADINSRNNWACIWCPARINLKNLMNMQNIKSFQIASKNMMRPSEALSYISIIQAWKGAAPILKSRALITRAPPIIAWKLESNLSFGNERLPDTE
jgi:hypothetical protein